MKFKKQIIAAITCAVVLLGVFLTVSYIGRDNNSTADNNNDKQEITTGNENQGDKTKEEDKKTIDEEENLEDKETSNDQQQSNKDEVKTGSYIVKKDDTLYSIARAYMPNHDFKEVIATIIEGNKLISDNKIVEGQTILIPYEVALESKATSSTTVVDKSKDTTAETALNTKTGKKYKIQPGDSLFKIAREQLPDVAMLEAVDKIKAHNDITDVDTIKAGDEIYIPEQ
jgi:LysM repeat protein